MSILSRIISLRKSNLFLIELMLISAIVIRLAFLSLIFFKTLKTLICELCSRFEANVSLLLTSEIQSSKSLPLISSLVSQIFLFKIKLFKKFTRLLANKYVPSSLKCTPSFHRCSLDTLSLLTK